MDDQVKIDASVVAALFVEHAGELHRFLTGMLRDHQLASDVLQTTFTRLVEGGHRTRPESRKAWLFRVAYHEALAVCRRQSVDRQARRRHADLNTHRPANDEPLIRMETVAAVRRALDQLPPAQREVVRMRIYEEKKFAEIARELNIPLGTALGRMRAALARLQRCLEDPGT